MDRELVLAVVAAALCGPILVLVGSFPALARERAGRPRERTFWSHVWWPLVPAAIVFAALAGWALQEPDAADESVTQLLVCLAAPFALVWLRAATRAVRALLATANGLPAATVGLLRPRVVVAPEFADMLEPEELHAVCEHEAAHARHCDPLRIWLAQLVTDLQWPSPVAGGRFRAWLHALEVARDEEARERGADGSDLAAAVLAAERFRAGRLAPVVAALTGDGEALKERIDRLLDPVPADEPRASRWRLFWFVLCLGSVVALLLGTFLGDALLRLLPGVVT